MQGYKGTFAEDYPEEPFPLIGDAIKAEEYLATAMQELGVSDPAEIQFTLNYAESESVRKIVEVIQAQWKKNLGLTVTLSPIPYAVLYTNQSVGEFEMMFGSWVPDYDDPMAYLEIFSTDNGYNFSKHNNPAYDAALAAAQAASDPKERMDYLAEAEKIVCMDAPMIVLSADRRAGMWDQNRILNFQPYYVGVQYNFMYADLAN